MIKSFSKIGFEVKDDKGFHVAHMHVMNRKNF